ncbi:MAG: RidA family protein, partial [Thaumarchaeota archaeon]|nr:RidA family protein [Nitrososphaerota archaeon]
GGGSIAAQIEQIYGNMGRVLDSVGAGLHNVVKTVDYLLSDGLEGYRDTADVRKRVFKGKFPASSGVLVKGLPTQNALIQVESIAVAD